MQGIMADLNFEGHLERLVHLLQGEARLDIWNDLNLQVARFDVLGLPRTASDRLVWQACQKHEYVLITANRSRDDSDSLQATIEDSNSATSLPVLTVYSADRLLNERTFAERAADELLDYLFDLKYYPERLLGAGRLPLPKL